MYNRKEQDKEMKRPVSICLIIFLFWTQAAAQSQIIKAFKPVCDSMSVLIQERSSVKGELKLKAVMKRGNTLDFYFTESLSDYPWKSDDYKWFTETLRRLTPENYRGYRTGGIYCKNVPMSDLITNDLTTDGSPAPARYKAADRRQSTIPIVKKEKAPTFEKGLSGRHIALWQSHGRYFEQALGRWEWQRPCLFQTVEDLFTQSFVLPYLVPMLENSGAYVILPRERDIQTKEIIIDNDPHFTPATDNSRTFGTYSENGSWSDAGSGFADTAEVYGGLENPFRSGTARSAACVQPKKGSTAEAVWTPEIPERGEYAVYISYKTLPTSTESAHYTVTHKGGESHFTVNQTMGGGTWIYLGTFEFEKGTEGKVTLDNSTPSGRKYVHGKTVSADAVKIGGGMGNIARKSGKDPLSSPETSGLPRFTEGARYWMQWAGIDTSVYCQNMNENDYMDDFMSRGAWVQYMSGGSCVNPKAEGKKIPIDLAFAFHSDAGVSPGDSIIGTLGIYTLYCKGSRKLPAGEDRMTGREFTDIVQSQVVNDLRKKYDPLWSRRHIWDRSYSESRTTGVPTMLLELLSHQNFADMKHGLDPAFRFTVSRSVYKGILKYLSNRYGCNYIVQPLPVNSFAVRFTEGNTAELSWKATPDSLEPTAVSESYILYTRIDGGAFDTGRIVPHRQHGGKISTDIDIEPGHIYSFKIAAMNKGGISFPSEILSAGIPASRNCGTDSCVLVINNFDRVSSPAFFDTPQYAGFDNILDRGVPYIRDIAFTGEMYQFRRDMPWCDDDNPGFGASYTDYAGKVIAGNTFDYPYVHGKAVMKAGYPFCSAGSQAFAADSLTGAGTWCTDIICGKQVTTRIGRGAVPDRYRVFPAELQKALSAYTGRGGDILISGAHIGTDVWDRVFPVECDSTFKAVSVQFAESVLGYRWISNYASRTSSVRSPDGNTFTFNRVPCGHIYSVETPDGLIPASRKARTILRYCDTGISAGTAYDSGTHKAISLGFPIETVEQPEALEEIIYKALKYFTL